MAVERHTSNRRKASDSRAQRPPRPGVDSDASPPAAAVHGQIRRTQTASSVESPGLGRAGGLKSRKARLSVGPSGCRASCSRRSDAACADRARSAWAPSRPRPSSPPASTVSSPSPVRDDPLYHIRRQRRSGFEVRAPEPASSGAPEIAPGRLLLARRGRDPRNASDAVHEPLRRAEATFGGDPRGATPRRALEAGEPSPQTPRPPTYEPNSRGRSLGPSPRRTRSCPAHRPTQSKAASTRPAR